VQVIRLEIKPQARKQISLELQTLHKCMSPCVVGFIGSFVANKEIHILMEYMVRARLPLKAYLVVVEFLHSSCVYVRAFGANVCVMVCGRARVCVCVMACMGCACVRCVRVCDGLRARACVCVCDGVYVYVYVYVCVWDRTT
jgi:hypothetical protein